MITIQFNIDISIFLLYLLTYLLLHERAAPIDVFRYAIHLEYNIDSVMKTTSTS